MDRKCFLRVIYRWKQECRGVRIVECTTWKCSRMPKLLNFAGSLTPLLGTPTRDCTTSELGNIQIIAQTACKPTENQLHDAFYISWRASRNTRKMSPPREEPLIKRLARSRAMRNSSSRDASLSPSRGVHYPATADESNPRFMVISYKNVFFI